MVRIGLLVFREGVKDVELLLAGLLYPETRHVVVISLQFNGFVAVSYIETFVEGLKILDGEELRVALLNLVRVPDEFVLEGGITSLVEEERLPTTLLVLQLYALVVLVYLLLLDV
mmetsp:Transcript_12425/g.12200  ORF Transcript_12425/g.12200 Transcript_12425/m.12200 type:complete len:115 (+) Transcript_12425:406-750(+)